MFPALNGNKLTSIFSKPIIQPRLILPSIDPSQREKNHTNNHNTTIKSIQDLVSASNNDLSLNLDSLTNNSTFSLVQSQEGIHITLDPNSDSHRAELSNNHIFTSENNSKLENTEPNKPENVSNNHDVNEDSSNDGKFYKVKRIDLKLKENNFDSSSFTNIKDGKFKKILFNIL